MNSLIRYELKQWRALMKGFTMVELIVVVSIVGVLTAIAIPVYQDYGNATQVRVLYAEVASYRTVVEERMASGKRGVSNDEIGFTQPRLAEPSTSFVIYNPDGSVSLSLMMGGAASPSLVGVSISTIRSIDGVWRCSINGSLAAGWKDRYRPVDC